jgi:hypothetical protein
MQTNSQFFTLARFSRIRRRTDQPRIVWLRLIRLRRQRERGKGEGRTATSQRGFFEGGEHRVTPLLGDFPAQEFLDELGRRSGVEEAANGVVFAVIAPSRR